MSLSDSTLITQFISGNSQSFSILVDRYQKRVYGFIFSKVNSPIKPPQIVLSKSTTISFLLSVIKVLVELIMCSAANSKIEFLEREL